MHNLHLSWLERDAQATRGNYSFGAKILPMERNNPGKTLREQARFTNCAGWVVITLALVILLVILYVALDEIPKLFQRRADPVKLLMLCVMLIVVAGLGRIATRLFNLNNRVQRGAQGEERVGAVLESLRAKGWHVFHDVPLRIVGNIDHLVIGPGGIFVVETKSHRGRITVQDNQLLRDGKPLEKDFLKQAETQSRVVSQLLQQHLRQNWYVQPIVCFANAIVLVEGNRVGNVWVLPLAWLTRELEHQPARLSPAQMQMLAGVIARLGT